jgi:hypothetical protein
MKHFTNFLLCSLLLLIINKPSNAQGSETLLSGSFIINMGITPQTIGNGLKPYGMIYDLLKNNGVPIKWVINPAKSKDGIDFTYNAVNYKGGTFIIPAEYRTSAVNAKITTWQASGVVGVTTSSSITVPVALTLTFAPVWTLNSQNTGIATTFFVNAGIPASAYNFKTPSQLGCCDDLFVMPHADPQWSTHGNLYTWNEACLGGIWLGCHAGSALEDMFNPANPSEQTNFLANKTGNASGGGPYFENALVLWGNHADGTPPYSYAYPAEPVMQFMGIIDAATQNGSEQIYLPKGAGWRSTTKIGVWDPTHPQVPAISPGPAAVIVFGQGLGLSTRGKVMMIGSHNIAGSSTPANIAAQRAFFNWSFWAAKDKEFTVTINGLPSTIIGNTAYNLSASIVANVSSPPYTYMWTSTCGGTFSNPTGASTIFTPLIVSGPISCLIQCKVIDACGRSLISSQPTTIICDLQVSTSFVNPCFNTPNGGAITMSITNGSGPYVWSWTKSGGGSGSGTGTTISGLSAGTYTVTVIANNGAGCPKTFTLTLTQSPQILIALIPVNVFCNGGATGAINASVTGGIPGYTYQWADGPTTQNRSSLLAGNYTVTVTDSKGCTASSTVSVTQPGVLNATAAAIQINCFGQLTGAINVNVTGGVSPYTYLWNDGATSQNRTGIGPGSYTVTVTDLNGCKAISNTVIITQPATIQLSEMHMNILCFGNTTGSIDLTVVGGIPPYTYSWTGPGPYSASTQDISGLGAGIYSVLVTDNNGCPANLAVTIIQPPALLLSTHITQPTCPPNASPPVNSDGAIDLTVTGGTVPYTYLWSTTNGSGLVPLAQDQTGLTAGTYNVLVTDNNGCTGMISVVLNYVNPIPSQPSSINH